MASNGSHGSPRDISRLMVGLLLGSGISGIAVGMIQGDSGVRPWGMAVFVLCLLASGLVFWFGETVIAGRDRRDLEKLGAAYCRALDAIAKSVRKSSERPGDTMGLMAGVLREETDKPVGEDEKVDWVQVFREGTRGTIRGWEKQSGKALPAEELEDEAGVFPLDAVPET